MAKKNEFFIDTRLGTDKLAGDTSKVKSMLSSLVSSTKEVGAKMGKALSSGLKEARTRGSGIDTDEYKAMEKQFDKLMGKYDKLSSKEQRFLDTGGNVKSRTYKTFEYDLETLEGALDATRAKLKTLQAESGQPIGTQALSGLEGKLYSVGNTLGRAFPHSLKECARGVVSLAGKVGGTLVGAFKRASIAAMSLAKSGFNALRSKLEGLKGGINGASNGFNMGFKNMLKYGLGIRSTFVLINRLRNALIDGFQNLAQFNGGNNRTAQSINMLKASLGQLKNSFASAFAPILTAVAPALNALIGLINKAVTSIGMLIAALTGQKTFTQATKQQTAYGASMDKSAKSAKNLAKAQKQLYSFDTLNKVDNKPDSGSDVGGGAGGGGGAGNMFKEVEIPNSFQKLADKIKEVLASDDWSSIGEMIATKINGVMAKIPWNKINSGAQHIAKGIATLINGFVGKLNWNLVGKTIANGINTAVAFANTLLTKIDFSKIGSSIAKALNAMIKKINWKAIGELFANRFNAMLHTLQGFVTNFNFAELGSALATALNGMINKIDWKAIGDTFSKSFIGILTTLSTFLKETDWSTLAKDIADMLKAVDWSGCAKALFDTLGAAVGAAVSLAGTWVKDAVLGIRDHFLKFIKDENGDGHFGAGEIIKGIKDGIVDAILGIGEWIKNNIFKPFIDGFKAAFQIHSPSKVMIQQGKYIIKGMLDGIVEALASIGSWVKTNIFEPFMKGLKTAFNIAGGVASTILDVGKAIVTGFTNGVSGIWESVKGIIDTFKSNFVGKFEGVKEGVVGAFDAMKKGVVEILEKLGGAIKKPANAILSGIESMANGVVAGLNKMIGALNNLKFDIPDWVPGLGGKSFGLNIGTIGKVKLPRLATGTVVPRTSREFAAILGDNNRETEVVSPLSTIKQALVEAISETGGMNGGNQTITIKFEGTGAELVRMLKPMIDKENKRVGTQLITGGVG